MQLFPKFRDLPKDEMYSSEPFRAHALNVTEAVDMAVSSLEDIPGLVSVLKDLGSVHCPFGIQDAHFDVSYLYGKLRWISYLFYYCCAMLTFRLWGKRSLTR